MKGGIFIIKSQTTAWQEYERGKEYHARIGLYETVRTNERFYRGCQWEQSAKDLPHPVFNLVRRVTDYLVSDVLSGDVSIHYTDDALPFADRAVVKEQIENGLSVLNNNAAWRWKQNRMEVLAHRALLDAAISGDGVFYCWWDSDYRNGQPFRGEIRTDVIDTTNLFVADVNSADLQSQEYVLIAGRASVDALRREAREAGCNEKAVLNIHADDDDRRYSTDLRQCEPAEHEKATYLIRFSKENGEVILEKSTRNCLIKRISTGLKHYPVTMFHWHEAKNCFHGNAPVSDMIANQKYINTAYAMAMKHMYNTAFSKIVYDKSRIPEWSNGVGEAIAAMGGGNVADAVSVVGVGQMQTGYLELIESVIEQTRNMMGATESALGDEKANNTSAILALQEASAISLGHVRANFYACIGELADIWADMLCTYSPPGKRLMIRLDNGKTDTAEANYELLKNELLKATAEAGNTPRYAPSATVTILDKLLSEGHLNLQQYLDLLPNGTLVDKHRLIQKILGKER